MNFKECYTLAIKELKGESHNVFKALPFIVHSLLENKFPERLDYNQDFVEQLVFGFENIEMINLYKANTKLLNSINSKPIVKKIQNSFKDFNYSEISDYDFSIFVNETLSLQKPDIDYLLNKYKNQEFENVYVSSIEHLSLIFSLNSFPKSLHIDKTYELQFLFQLLLQRSGRNKRVRYVDQNVDTYMSTTFEPKVANHKYDLIVLQIANSITVSLPNGPYSRIISWEEHALEKAHNYLTENGILINIQSSEFKKGFKLLASEYIKISLTDLILIDRLNPTLIFRNQKSAECRIFKAETGLGIFKAEYSVKVPYSLLDADTKIDNLFFENLINGQIKLIFESFGSYKEINHNIFIYTLGKHILNLQGKKLPDEIYEFFEPNIQQYDYSFDFINHEVLLLDPVKFFDNFLYEINNQSPRNKDFSIQPKEITELMDSLSLMDINQGVVIRNSFYQNNLDFFYKRYNPFSGMASFLSNDSVGEEYSENIYYLASLRMLIKGDYDTIDFQLKDSLKALKEHKEKSFTLIISTPPFGKISKKYKENQITSYVEYLIHYGLDLLNWYGKLVVLTPDNFLDDSRSKSLRNHLIENDLIEYVISLPSGILHGTGLKTSIIVINKNKIPPNKKKIKLIDATDCYDGAGFNKRLVVKKIKQRVYYKSDGDKVFFIDENFKSDFNLNIHNHLRLNQIEDLLSSKNSITKLSSVIETATNYSEKPEKGEKVIKIKDLHEGESQTGVVDGLRPLNLEDVESEFSDSNLSYIDYNTLLISKIGNHLKPTYFLGSKTPAFISNNIASFVINLKEVTPEYLVSELNKKYITLQLDNKRVGVAQKYISTSDFLDIRIDIPTIQEQNEIFIEKAVDSISNLNRKVEEITYSTYEELFEELRLNKHATGKYRQNLSDGLALIKDVLLSMQPIHLEIFDNYFRDDTINSSLDLISKLEFDFKQINNYVINSTLLQQRPVATQKLKSVSLIEFKKMIEKSLQSDYKFKFSINFDISGYENSGVKINGYLLDRLFTNLSDNFIKHGLKENYQNELIVNSYIENPNNLIIEIKNNGKPFPSELTKVNFIKKKKDNTSLGGYDIDLILKHFGDKNWKLYLNEDPLYPVIFSFKLKLYTI